MQMQMQMAEFGGLVACGQWGVAEPCMTYGESGTRTEYLVDTPDWLKCSRESSETDLLLLTNERRRAGAVAQVLGRNVIDVHTYPSLEPATYADAATFIVPCMQS